MTPSGPTLTRAVQELVQFRSVRVGGVCHHPVRGVVHPRQFGVVRDERVTDHPADRTDGNWARYFVRSGYEDPFGE